MNRKTKFLKTSLLLVCVLVGTFTSGAYNFVVDGIYYNKNGNEATVTFKTTSYNTYSGDVIIPPTVTYGGVTYTVTAIGDNAFNKSTGLTDVEIPNTVKSFGAYAFGGCTSITSITIPNSVTNIGDYAFQSCTSLASVEIPNSVTSIGSYAFKSCSRLSSFIIPNSITTINAWTFQACSGLTNVTIPNSVTTIKEWAFGHCSGLAHVTIPNSVTSIGSSSFVNCSGLISLTIPNSVTSIGDQAFLNCYQLTNVTLPNSVTSLEQSTFCNCRKLTKITIPNSVKSIAGFVFKGCTNLTSITLGNSVNSIGTEAFSGCSALTEIVIPSSVTTIGSAAFMDCAAMTKATIGDSVTTIGQNAFKNCTVLSHITIPNSVSSIAQGCFSGCTSLDLLYFNAENCANLYYSTGSSTAANSVFYNCPLKTIVIGDDVKTIPAYLTATNLKSRLTTLIIGNSVTAIGASAFQSCTGLTSLTLPNSLSSIGSNAFASCSNLKTIFISGEGEWKAGTLPMNSSIKTLYIGSGITLLSDMRVNPTDVYCYAAVPPTCHANAFTGYTGKLHVPSSSYATYCFALTWENFTDIEAGAVEPTTIRLNKTSLEMAPTEEQTLTATVQPSGAYPNAPIIWWTTDPNVAIVENGVVTAVAPGECDVIASCYPVRSVCHVTVDDTSSHIVITLDQHEAEVKVNHMITLIPTMTPEETELVVTSSDPTVAGARIVNGNVRVVGIHVGETTITVASADGTAQPATCLVKVFTDPGDVNCDGAFSIGDVTALISILLSDDGMDNPYADVNGDGRVSIGDVTALINILLSGE